MKSSVSTMTSNATSTTFENDHLKRALREDIVAIPSVAKPHVFVLALRARVDLVLLLLLVAIERRVGERRRIGLALIRALLVVDHLRTFAAARQREGERDCADQRDIAHAHHDFVPPAGGDDGCGAAGAGP